MVSMKIISEKQLLKERKLTPKRWLGQNLLLDQAYLERIVQGSAVKPGEHVVEIGAGLGSLTEHLVNAGASVWALEIDSGFFRALQEKFADVPSIELIHGDALKWDFRSLAGDIGPLKVVANLPYSVSSRLLFKFFEHRDVVDSIHVLLQKEVAQRLTAQVGTKDYGILTVLLGITAQVTVLFDIPPRAFFPVPAVHSSFVRIIFPQEDLCSIPDTPLLISLVKNSFRARRKTLKNNLLGPQINGLRREAISTAAQLCSIDLGRRAETLTPGEFADFTTQLSKEQAQTKHSFGP
jgi:16S rRNA (adenine1518-N6/adenine1519-N6)-dimethyltransferase